jgi:DNA-binding NtrC family response regulator
LRKEITGISAEAIACLGSYNWPGNIRELENLMERTMLFCEGPQIEARDLPPELTQLSTLGSTVAVGAPAPAARLTSSIPVVTEDPVSGPSGSTAAGVSPTPTSLPVAPAGGAGSLKEAVRAETERVERELIIRALDETNGNVTQAARKLKISRKSLQTKMKEFGLRDREAAREG